MRQNYSTAQGLAPAPGYTVWQDGKGWRWTNPDGTRDGPWHATRAGACKGSHGNAKVIAELEAKQQAAR